MTMTHSAKAIVTLPTDEEILITREFQAPPHLVYRAYTTPELVKRWWSGRRGSPTSVEIDLRVGGAWRYVMVTTEGFEVAFRGEYREIEPDRRLVNTEIFEAMPEGVSVVTTTFEPAGAGTLLRMRSVYPSKAVRDAVIESGMEGGMQEGMDILEEITAELA